VTAGAIAGAGATLYTQYRLKTAAKTAVRRYLPEQLARSASEQVRAAVAEGLQAMREREQELRQRFGPPAGLNEGDEYP
jgi:pyrroline-5-carboxylate reductase